jgi:hypothetical protein
VDEARFDLAPQRLVSETRVAQKRRALGLLARERLVIQLLDLLAAI